MIGFRVRNISTCWELSAARYAKINSPRSALRAHFESRMTDPHSSEPEVDFIDI